MAIVIVALIFLGLVGTLIMMRPTAVTDAELVRPGDDPLQPDEMLVGYAIPDFELTDQDGRPVDASILDGHVTILAFIFTNCPFACPGMTGQMVEHQDRLEGTGVRFLSISVDPDNDTPEVLRAYGERNEVCLLYTSRAGGRRRRDPSGRVQYRRRFHHGSTDQ